jgi:hypothetical protein
MRKYQMLNSHISQLNIIESSKSDKFQKSFNFRSSLLSNSSIPAQTPVKPQSPDNINTNNSSSAITNVKFPKTIMANSCHAMFNEIPRMQQETETGFSCKTLFTHIKIFSETANDYKDYNRLRKWLEENKIGHCSFRFQPERILPHIIKCIPRTENLNEGAATRTVSNQSY